MSQRAGHSQQWQPDLVYDLDIRFLRYGPQRHDGFIAETIERKVHDPGRAGRGR